MSDLSLDLRVSVRPEIIYRELEGEAVLLNLQAGVYHGLNSTGTRMWVLMSQRRSLGEVLEVMKSEYDIAPDALERDLLALTEELRANGLIDILE